MDPFPISRMSILIALHTSRESERKFITHPGDSWGEKGGYKHLWPGLRQRKGMSLAFIMVRGLKMRRSHEQAGDL